MKPEIHVPIGAPKTTMAGVLHRWGPGKLWAILTEDGDLDTFVRAETEGEAIEKARANGCEGDLLASEQDESTRDAINERLLFAAGDIRFLLAEVDRLTAEMTEARKPFAYADPLADANGNRHHKDGSRCADAYCRRAHALPVAVNVTPCPLPCPTCGYNDVPGTTHSTACLYPDAKVTP